MELFLFLYLYPILSKLDLKNDFLNISKLCLPMIIWTFFQTSEDIYIYKECHLPNALRPTSFSYLDLYCDDMCNKESIMSHEKYISQFYSITFCIDDLYLFIIYQISEIF